MTGGSSVPSWMFLPRLSKRHRDQANDGTEQLEVARARFPDVPPKLVNKAWLRIFRSFVFGPSGFWTMAPLRCGAKFDPFLSLDCARVEGVGRNPRKGRDQILHRSVAEP